MPEATTARPALAKKKSIILGTLWVAVIVFIFVRVIPQVGSSYEDAITTLQSMSAGAVACIVLSLLVYLLVYGLPFMAATPGLPYWRSQQLNQAAYVITKCVPGGGAFGLGLQYEMLASYGVGPTVSTAAITAVGVWSVFVTLGLLILGVAAIQLSGHAASSYFWPAAIGVLALAVAILAFGFFMRSEDAARRIGSIGNRIAAPFVRRFRKGRNFDLVPAALKLRADIADLVARRWLAITGAQTSVSITQFLILYMSLRGVEGWDAAGTSVLVAFGAFAVAQIGLMIPITPGGLGTVDATMIAVLIALGVDAGAATAADLVWRSASLVPQIMVGLVALITWSRQEKRGAGRAGDHPPRANRGGGRLTGRREP